MWCEACLAGLPRRDKKHTNEAGCLYTKAKEDSMKWIVRSVLVACLAAWAVFFSSGCVDIPGVPIDGQVYLCTFSDAHTGEVLHSVERCGPWDDWTVPADELAAEYVESGAPREVTIDCRGTHRACAWEP